MKTFAVVIILIGFGLFAWAIGSRLSTDAVGMGVGLVFGVLAGVPAALLVLVGSRRTHDDDGDAYAEGYRQGIQDTTAMARGAARMLPEHAQYTPARPFTLVDVHRTTTNANGVSVEENHVLPVDVAVQLREALDALPARPTTTHCANWELCPNCHLPLTPDEHCPEWCGFPAPTEVQ